MTLQNWLRSRPANTTPRPAHRPRLGVQQLEAREVPAADFLSAFGVGNAVGVSEGRDVAVDATGNSYLTGLFSGTADFDPAHDRLGGADLLTARGPRDAFVAKYAPDGSLAWATRMGGEDADSASKVALDASGNVFVAGSFRGTGDFGPTARTSSGGADGFVAKLDPDGTVMWATQWGTTADETSQGVGVDAGGNAYAVSYRATGTTTAARGYDILKFSPTGAVAWTKWVNTRAGSPAADLATDAGGNVYVAGQFNGTVDFDPGSRTKYVSSGSKVGGFVLKLTSAGNLGWVTPFVGQGSGTTAGHAAAQSIALDGSGGMVVGGYYGGTVVFGISDGGTTSPPIAGGGFVTKLGPDGSNVWTKAMEKDPAVASSSMSVYGLAVDAAGGIYATGSLYGTADFDPGAAAHSRTAAGGSDVFVLKLDAGGSFAWAETFGGGGSDLGWGVAVDPAGTVSLAGVYRETVDFNPDPTVAFDLSTPGNFGNAFLVRLRQN